MVESVLLSKKVSFRAKMGIKTLISVLLIAAAVGLPMIVHFISGAPGGARWLPMYLPVLLGGCLLGAKWGFAVGAFSPIVSYLITTALGSSMPALERLPFMIAELAVLAWISGLWSRKIAQHSAWSFPAVASSFVIGRSVFLALVYLFRGVSTLSPGMIWTQVRSGMAGAAIQCVLVPAIVIGISLAFTKREKKYV